MREIIYLALWQRLACLNGFKTKSRRLQHWSAVDKRQQPALFMAQVGESAVRQAKKPTQWQLNVDCYIYVYVDEKKAPTEVLNGLLDAVCNAIKPEGISSINTLGLDEVMDCFIEGKIETDEGTLGNQAIAIVPITILACF